MYVRTTYILYRVNVPKGTSAVLAHGGGVEVLLLVVVVITLRLTLSVSVVVKVLR